MIERKKEPKRLQENEILRKLYMKNVRENYQGNNKTMNSQKKIYNLIKQRKRK